MRKWKKYKYEVTYTDPFTQQEVIVEIKAENIKAAEKIIKPFCKVNKITKWCVRYKGK